MSRRGWVLFATMSVLWGLPYVLIRVAVEHVTPGTLVFFRTAGAALVLLPLALARGQIAPVLARWRPLVLFAVIEMMIPWLMIADAEQELSSSLAGLLVASVPLIGALLAWFSVKGDKVSRTQLVGMLLGVTGVAALVGLDFTGLNMFAFLELAVAATCYAVGPIILIRSLADLPGLGVIAASLTITSACFLPFFLLQPPGAMPASAVSSLVLLSLLCTAVAFLVFFQLIAAIGPTRSTLITYVNPAVALTLGVLVLNEVITLGMLVGFPLILAGSILGARKAKAVVTRPQTDPVPAV